MLCNVDGPGSSYSRPLKLGFLTSGGAPLLLLMSYAFTAQAWESSPTTSQDTNKRLERGRPGLLRQLGDKIAGGCPLLDLASSMVAVAEVAMDPASERVLANYTELGFFAQGALTRLTLAELEAFRKELQLKPGDRLALGMIGVAVKGDLVIKGEVIRRSAFDHYCVMRGELLNHLDKFRKPQPKPVQDGQAAQQGVSLLWAEDIGAKVAPGPPAPRKIEADISLVCFVIRNGKAEVQTRAIRFRNKEHGRWELVQTNSAK